MSLRIAICFAVVIGLSLYAWRNWFVPLCGLMVLMAILQHPDMPHGILGIQGFNAWNVMMLCTLLGWYSQRRRDGLAWDMPRYMTWLFFCYLFVVIWSFVRLAFDYDALNVVNNYVGDFGMSATQYTFGWIASEYVINCVKWLLPGVLLFDACRTRRRVEIALIMIFLFYILTAVQVIQHMPLSSVVASGTELSRKASKLNKLTGFFRTEVSMMLAGASWAILSFVVLVKKRLSQLALIGASLVVSFGQALTGGRAGYVTWGLVGLTLCVLRWRRLLPVIPAAIIAVCIFMPGVSERMLQGFEGEKVDTSVVTSGRMVAWSYVIPKIGESPLMGYGRQAMIRTGIFQKLMDGTFAEGEAFPHPHNAYLEILLDDGFIGFFLIMPIYFVTLAMSFSLLRDRSDPLFSVVGSAAAALILGLMFASMGSQSFYAKESSVGMWAAIGVMLRVYVERKRSRETGEPMFGEEESEAGDFVPVHEPAMSAQPVV